MNNLIGLLLTLLGLVLLLDLIAVAAHTAFRSTNLARLLALRKTAEKTAARALSLLNSGRKTRITLRLLNTFTHLCLAGILLALLNMPTVQNFWVNFGALALSALVLGLLESLVAEQVLVQPENWLIRLSGFIQVFGGVLLPVLLLTQAMGGESNGLAEPTGSVVTEAELKTMVDASQQDGVLEQEERKMIFSIFDLGDTLAREIMVPRIDVLAIDAQMPIEQVVASLLQSGYSRLPVYETTIDNIQGLVYAKDLLNAWHAKRQVNSLRELLRPAYFIPEAKRVDQLLTEMQARQIHMAIVVDEYGGVAGLVTLEDIVEEIVGEIRDEFDQGEEAFYQQVAPHEYICSGRMDLDDFNELLEVQLPNEDADTLGGFIYSSIGRVPNGGETLQIDDLILTVEQISKRRIHKVRAKKFSTENTVSEETNHVAKP